MATMEPQRTVREPTTPPTMAPMLLGGAPPSPPTFLVSFLFESPVVASAPEADGAVLVSPVEGNNDEVKVPVSEAILDVEAGACDVDVVGWTVEVEVTAAFVAKAE